MTPSRPTGATTAIAIALLVIGLALIFFQGQATDLVRSIGLPNDVQRQVVQLMQERIAAWGALAASPVLLIIGSLVKGI
jgi:hypothetical protein